MTGAMLRRLSAFIAVCGTLLLLQGSSCDRPFEGALPGECSDTADNDVDGLYQP
jgi:hypothetical protein